MRDTVGFECVGPQLVAGEGDDEDVGGGLKKISEDALWGVLLGLR